MSRLFTKLVNWLVRDVKIERLRVRDLCVGDNTTILTDTYIEFDALDVDPAVAPASKARLCAVSGNLRVSHATPYSTVGSGGGGGSSDLVSRTGLVLMAPTGAGVLETVAGAGTATPVTTGAAGTSSVGAGAVSLSPAGSAALI